MLNSNTVTRLPGGLSTTALDKIFSSMPFPDPTAYHEYCQDFDQFVAGDWTVTETQAGATQALISGDGGTRSLVNSAASADVNQIQKLPSAFLPSATKQLFGKFRVSLDDATLSDFVVGLATVSADATVLANSLDGFFFRKAAGAATINFYVRKDNTTGSNVAIAIAALVNATYVDLAFYYDGQGRVYYSVNGTVLGYLDASSTYFPDAITTVTVAQKNSSAVARTTNVDLIYIGQER